MDIVDGGMVVGEKILLTSNASKQRQKLSSEDRKSARSRLTNRKSRSRFALKSRETEKEEEFDNISSSISTDSDSDGPDVGTKNDVFANDAYTVVNDDSNDSGVASRKDSGLPSSRYNMFKADYCYYIPLLFLFFLRILIQTADTDQKGLMS
jgi:hypothetical protein